MRAWKVLVTYGTRGWRTYARASSRSDAEALRLTAIDLKYRDAWIEDCSEKDLGPSASAD